MSSTGALTELDDLRIFLQERVQEFDSGIDTTLGSSFDSLVIQPLISRIGPDPYATGIVDFIQGRLRGDFGPENLILQDGEPIDDLVVRPNRILLEAFRRQIRLVSLNQSLANPELLNEKEADNLGANFFVRRRLGGFSIGVARIYFTAPQFVLVTPSNSLFTGSGLQYFPIESQAITADRMVFNEEDNLFFFDIVVRAEKQGATYNIPANTLTTIEGITSVVKVTNKRAFDDGGDKETTTQFIERIENSLTEKSLVTTRGIRARLFDTFENVQLIQVIGHGDPEMNRDILTGQGEEKPYGVAELDALLGVDQLELGSATSFYTSAGNGDYTSGPVQVGDLVQLFDFIGGGGLVSEHTVVQLVSDEIVQVSPAPAAVQAGDFAMFRRATGKIAISDIPGGILGPSPTIVINDDEVHIGGAYDVYVRAGDPQERETTLEGVLDAEPLRFGVDLESYGSDANQFVHVTDVIAIQTALPDTDRFGNAILDADLLEILIKKTDDLGSEFNPWVPTDDDIGRYIQIVPPGATTYRGTFRISEILGEEYYSGEECVRIKIDIADEETGGLDAAWITATSGPVNTFTLDVRIVEEVSIKNRVRDRDRTTTVIAQDVPDFGDPPILGGVNFSSISASIGDSVVIETGDDAGIYSIRRILSWLSDNDTLILDRDLTDTVKTTGPQTGLRYRIADELNVDLIEPKVPKIPLGDIFLGGDLSSVAGSNAVTVSGTTNFLLAGVEVGDTLEITAGPNIGTYTFTSVSGTSAEVNLAMLSTLSSQTFEVYRAFTGVNRPMVRVKEVELLDSNSQPTGITIPYGDVIDARILGTLSNRAQGNIVESFTGDLQDNGAGLVDLFDANIDFDLENVEPGFRLNIINGNSVGSYTILATGTDPVVGLTSNHIRMVAVADGGTAFLGAATDIHYSIGLPSAGIARLFFLEPTSVEVTTGLSGGRIQFSEGGVTPKVFRFSEVSGFSIVPARGDPDDDARDLRVVRSNLNVVTTSPTSVGVTTVGTGIYTHAGETFISDGVRATDILRLSGLDAGDHDILSVDSETQLTVSTTFTGDSGVDHSVLRYNTLVEFTDLNRPGVFELEIQEGDVVEVNEPLPFRVKNTGAPFLGQTFDEAGIFGAPAPLQTRAGDSLVTVPANSAIDFTEMNLNFPLVGQTLYIESGPDAGSYIIESVVDAKSLRLNSVMTNTTGALVARDVNDRTGLSLADSAPNTKLTDTDDIGQISLLAEGQYITIFESTRSDIDGTHQISDLIPTETDSIELEVAITNHAVDMDSIGVGPFSWIATSTDNAGPAFHIYKTVATEFEVLEVAPKRADPALLSGVFRADITTPDQLVDSGTGDFSNVKGGDLVEILEGDSQGVYHVESVSGSTVTIHAEIPFPVSDIDIGYRIWGGLHGSRRMLRLGPKDSSSGRVAEGDLIPYRVLRPAIQRVSSTEMEENFDGTLFFVDIQIESDGAGDDLNLVEKSRMEVTSGLRADGYTYSVENENLTFSTFEEVGLNFDRRFLPVGNSDSPENLTEVSGRNLRVAYETSTTTKLVNDLMRSDQDRVVNANPIARHFLPSFLFVSLQYRGGITEQNMGPQLENLVNSQGAEAELRVSDLEAVLMRNGAEAIEHPIELVTVTHDLGRQLVVNRSDNKIGGLNTVPFNGTGRISAFFTEFEETLLLVRES
jgi:hypothetical protein